MGLGVVEVRFFCCGWFWRFWVGWRVFVLCIRFLFRGFSRFMVGVFYCGLFVGSGVNIFLFCFCFVGFFWFF